MKFGFSSGYSCHFHILPVNKKLLNEIVAHPGYTNEPDGIDVLLFACREYGERALTAEEQALQIKAVKQLRAQL